MPYRVSRGMAGEHENKRAADTDNRGTLTSRAETATPSAFWNLVGVRGLDDLDRANKNAQSCHPNTANAVSKCL